MSEERVDMSKERVYESSDDDEGQVLDTLLHNPQHSRDNAKYTSRKRLLYVLAAACVAAVTFAAALAFVISRPGHNDARHTSFGYEVKKIERLRESKPNAVNKTWECLPNQNGLVYLDRQKEKLEQNGLPSGDGEHNLYGIGWMHQMYCLALFRNSLYSLLYDGSVSPWGGFERQTALGTQGMQAHIDDCFDYVRQKIMCAGDMTIEGAADPSDRDPLGGTHHIDGFGETVTCVDKLELGKWAEAHPPTHVMDYPGYGKYLKPPKKHSG